VDSPPALGMTREKGERRLIVVGFLFKDSFQLPDERGEVFSDDGPNDIEVDIDIAVCQAVAGAGYRLPRDFWMLRLKRIGDGARCLADNFNEMYGGNGEHLVSVEIDAALSFVKRDSLTGEVEHVADADDIGFMISRRHIVP